MDQKRVDFQAGGNLLEYMQRAKEEARKIAAETLAGAQKQTSVIKEQIELIKKQLELEQKKRTAQTGPANQSIGINQRAIDALKAELGQGNISTGRRMSLLKEIEARERSIATTALKNTEAEETNRLLREIADTLKENERKRLESSGEILNDLIDAQQKQQLADQQNEQPSEDKTSKKGKKGGLFGSLLGVENIKQLTGDVRQALRTENGFDAVVSTSSAGGRIVGGILGAIIGSIIEPGGGTMVGAGLGATLGAEISGGITEQMKRAYDSRSAFIKAAFAHQAVTGADETAVQGGNINRGNALGLSLTDIITLNTEIAKRQARGVSNFSAENMTALERALGISSQTTMELIDTQRLDIEQQRDTTNTITGLLKAGELKGLFKGGDRTFLGEFVGQFSNLSKQLGNVQTKIDEGLVAGTLLKFNSIGGQYSLRDPRAMGNITNINSALANPQDDIARAINFRILRRSMPNASLDQLNEEESKGIFSKSLLQGVLQQYGNAPKGTVLTALRNRFGGQLSFDAIRELYNNRSKILSGTADVSQIMKQGGMNKEDLFGQAEKLTTQADKFRAEITNAYIQGAEEGVGKAIEKITDAMAAVFDRSSVKITIDNNGNVTTDVSKGQASAKPNYTKVPTDYKQRYPGNSVLAETGLGF